MNPDIFEPVARAVGELVSNCPGLYRWGGYTANEDLIALEQISDDQIRFIRSSDRFGRIDIFRISPKDLTDIKFHDPTVLKTTRKAGASIEIDNRSGLTPEEYEWVKEFNDGESELDSVSTGFSASSKTTFGTGEGSSYKFEQEFEFKITNEWSKQTGKTKDTKTGGKFSLVALPKTHVRGWLEWNEQDLRRRIEGLGTFDCAIRIGKFAPHKKTGKRWRWQGDLIWNSLDDLIASAERRGSVHFPGYSFWMKNPPSVHLIDPIKLRPRNPFNQYVDYVGNDGIRVVIETLEDLRDDEYE